MIAIHTKFIPCSNTKGSRIKAYIYKVGSHRNFNTTISYPHEYSYEQAHFEAVKALVQKHNLPWDLSNMRFGNNADGDGYVFCFDQSKVAA